MNYIKVTFSITPHSTVAGELFIAELGAIGYDSFAETDSGFEAFISKSEFKPEQLTNISILLSDVSYTYTISEIEDQNWNKVWEEKYFQPIKIGNEVLIRGTFHKKTESVKYDLIIDPKMAFGTGHHETTGLMIQHLLEMNCSDLRVLDMGCGTGVLGILCARKGASQVIGIDIEEWAYHNAIENCELNKIENMQIIHGDASAIGEDMFNLIVANINRNILLNDIPQYTAVLANGGTLLVSGFYEDDIPAIDDVVTQQGLSLQSSKIDNHWAALAYRKTD
jgi:ribosomal protein L11 methyltransferase